MWKSTPSYEFRCVVLRSDALRFSGEIDMRITTFFRAASLVLLVAGGAQARCVGGGLIKGSFGATLGGPLTGGATAEAYGGVLTADGACNITGSLAGGVYGNTPSTQSVTGTYAVPANRQGTLSLSIGGASPVAFDIGLEKDGKTNEVTGIAVSGPATATLDMVAIAQKTYSLSSLSGTYIATCTGAANAQAGANGPGTELAYVKSDGQGNLAVTAIANNNGSTVSVTLPATYTVNPDGSFHIQDGGAFTQFTVVGAIVAGGSELRDVLLDAQAGYGAYRFCVDKKQGG